MISRLKPFLHKALCNARLALLAVKAIGFASIVCLAISSPIALSEEYYRWLDEQGVVHYGSTPPPGVEATKVKTYGGSSKSTNTTRNTPSSETKAEAPMEDLSNLPPEEVERRKKVAEAQKKVCDQEKARLAVLNKPGRIRMKQPDGSFTYMSQDEIQSEIATTKSVINDACQ